MAQTDVELWTDRISFARKARQKRAEVWKEMLRFYLGDHPIPNIPEQYRVPVNLAFSTINIMASALYPRHPRVLLAGARPDAEGYADTLAAVVNRDWKETAVKCALKACVQDGLIFGEAYAKLGTVTGNSAVEVPEGDDEKAPEAERETPAVWRISPMALLQDPDAVTFGHVRWLIHVLERDIDEVKGERLYNGEGVEALVSESEANSTEKGWRFTELESGLREKKDRILIYECWDRVKGTVTTIAEGHKIPLRGPEKIKSSEGLPFVQLVFWPEPDSLHGTPIVKPWDRLQLEADKFENIMVDALRRAKVAYQVSPEVDDKTVDQLRTCAPGTVLKTQGTINIIPNLVLGPEIYQQRANIRQDIEAVSGLSEFRRGAEGGGSKTATEATLGAESFNARMQAMADAVEAFVTEVARKFVQLVQETTSIGEVARIVGIDGATHWRTLTREAIAAEYDVTIEVGTLDPTPAVVRRKQLVELTQLAAQLKGVVPQLDVGELFRRVLKDAGVTGIDMILPPAPKDGLSANEENFRLSRGEAVDPTEHDDHALHIQSHAKVADYLGRHMQAMIAEVQAGRLAEEAIDQTLPVAIQATQDHMQAHQTMLSGALQEATRAQSAGPRRSEGNPRVSQFLSVAQRGNNQK